MPKLRDTPKTRMDRAFMAALRYGQAMRGETDKDTMRLMPKSTATYYKRLHNLDGFTREELRILIPRYFNDRQLCDAFGVEYHGGHAGAERRWRRMSKTRNERRLRRSRAIGSAVFTVCILLALFADSWVEIIL